MTEYLWMAVWMLLDNAVQIAAACLIGVGAMTLIWLSIFGLFGILISR